MHGEITSRTRLFQGEVLQVERRTVTHPDGHQTDREVATHPDAVCAAVFTPEGAMVLVRQFRAPVEGPLVEIPAGRIQPGERPEEAVMRELREEIGLVSGRVTPLFRFYPAPGFCTESMTLYRVDEAALAEPSPEPDERLERLLWSPAEARVRAGRGEIHDGKTLLAILATCPPGAEQGSGWPAGNTGGSARLGGASHDPARGSRQGSPGGPPSATSEATRPA